MSERDLLFFSPVTLVILVAAFLFSCWAYAEAGEQPSPPGLRAAGTIRALVVGIDRYPNLPDAVQLSGAAADARDIEAALRHMGVSDITLLIDTAATRAAFTEAIEALTKNAHRGDLIIITFAGHGSQDKKRVTEPQSDGMEAFVLSLIDEQGPNTRERIIDREVFAWLKRLGDKGAELLFVADSCHGGGMTKAPNHGGQRRGVRGLTRVYDKGEAGPGTLYISPENDQLSVPASIPDNDNATFDIPSLTFLAGVDADSEVIELTIEGRPRGALSYAFARALDGTRITGEITREKLFKSVHEQVLQLTEQKQDPVMEPRTLESAKHLLFTETGKAAELHHVQVPTTKIVTLEGSRSAPTPFGLHVFWDGKTGDVISETNSVLAYSVPQSALPTVAKRVSTTAALVQLASQVPLQVTLSPKEKDYASDQEFRLMIDGIYERNLLIVNLAGDGRVQYLFPKGNANPLMMENRLTIPIRAAPPFGTDTLIVLASRNRQRELELDLSLLDKQSKPEELFSTLEGHIGRDDLLGIASYSTHP